MSEKFVMTSPDEVRFGDPPAAPGGSAPFAVTGPDLSGLGDLLNLSRQEVLDALFDAALDSFDLALPDAAFGSPGQLRLPAGQAGGGEWTSGGGATPSPVPPTSLARYHHSLLGYLAENGSATEAELAIHLTDRLRLGAAKALAVVRHLAAAGDLVRAKDEYGRDVLDRPAPRGPAAPSLPPAVAARPAPAATAAVLDAFASLESSARDGLVDLADLRERSGLSREDFDEAVLALRRDRRLRLVGAGNAGALSDRTKAAAILGPGGMEIFSHAERPPGASAPFYSPDQPRDELGRWTEGYGTAERPGFTPAQHRERRQAAADAVRAFASGQGPPTAAEAEALAGHLARLTVSQIHALKAEHGLKGSAPNKAALVAKLAQRFAAWREGRAPREAVPDWPEGYDVFGKRDVFADEPVDAGTLAPAVPAPAGAAAAASPLSGPALHAAVEAKVLELVPEHLGLGTTDPADALVPIWRVRRSVPAVSRQQFDDAVRQLWRNGKVRLVARSTRDLPTSKTTADQWEDAIKGVNETFFYVQPTAKLGGAAAAPPPAPPPAPTSPPLENVHKGLLLALADGPRLGTRLVESGRAASGQMVADSYRHFAAPMADLERQGFVERTGLVNQAAVPVQTGYPGTGAHRPRADDPQGYEYRLTDKGRALLPTLGKVSHTPLVAPTPPLTPYQVDYYRRNPHLAERLIPAHRRQVEGG